MRYRFRVLRSGLRRKVQLSFSFLRSNAPDSPRSVPVKAARFNVSYARIWRPTRTVANQLISHLPQIFANLTTEKSRR